MSPIFKTASRLSHQLKFNLSHSQFRSFSTIKVKNGRFKVLLLFGTPLGIGAGYYLLSQEASTFDAPDSKPTGRFAINAQEFTPFKIKEIQEVTHDTKLYRFEVPENQSLLLPVTSCVVTRVPPKKGEKEVVRYYTPVSDEDALGYFDLLIKHYPNGAMTKYLASLKPGDSLDAKGPVLKYIYKANTLDEVGLIAGGSGITPMLQLVRKILNNPKDRTKISLIFANRTESDIMLKEEFDNYARTFPDRFRVHYVLDTPPPNWTGSKGFITKEFLEKHLPSKDVEDLMIFVCGPLPMVEMISGKKRFTYFQGEVGGLLKELGYTRENVYNF